MAGYPSIIHRKERANTVRPQEEFDEIYLNLVHVKPKQDEREKADAGDEGQNKWEKMAQQYEELETRVVEQFEDVQRGNESGPPIIKVPNKPTKEEWERHQVTHTPFAACCPHCAALFRVA